MNHLDQQFVRVYIPEILRTAASGSHVPLAAFLLGTQNRKHMGTWRDSFCHEMDFSSYCVLAERPEKSDFILFPFGWDSLAAEQFANENLQVDALSRKTGRAVICHGFTPDILNADSISLPFANGVYLSSTLVRCYKPKHAMGLSYFIPDCRAKHASGPRVLPKPEKPTVGFCGVAAPLATPLGKTHFFDLLRLGLSFSTALGMDPESLARFAGTNIKHAYRARLILQFRRRAQIECNFILRSRGGLVDNSYTNKADHDIYNTGFYENLEQNLYTLCCRGSENYSVRFYETLCMGRIPIIIDTDLVLPFDDSVDYSQHGVWIQKKDIASAADILLEFHQSHSADELAAIQQSNRMLWETHLMHKNYYRQLVHQLAGKDMVCQS